MLGVGVFARKRYQLLAVSGIFSTLNSRYPQNLVRDGNVGFSDRFGRGNGIEYAGRYGATHLGTKYRSVLGLNYVS